MSLEVVLLSGFLLGLLIVLGLGLRTRTPIWALGLATLGLCIASFILLVATYKDEHCDEDTACRVFAEPSYFVLSAVVPGMGVGLVGSWAWRRRRTQPPRSASEGPGGA